MSSLRTKLRGKKPPEGWELIEEVIQDFEQQKKVGCIRERLGADEAAVPPLERGVERIGME